MLLWLVRPVILQPSLALRKILQLLLFAGCHVLDPPVYMIVISITLCHLSVTKSILNRALLGVCTCQGGRRVVGPMVPPSTHRQHVEARETIHEAVKKTCQVFQFSEQGASGKRISVQRKMLRKALNSVNLYWILIEVSIQILGLDFAIVIVFLK